MEDLATAETSSFPACLPPARSSTTGAPLPARELYDRLLADELA